MGVGIDVGADIGSTTTSAIATGTGTAIGALTGTLGVSPNRSQSSGITPALGAFGTTTGAGLIIGVGGRKSCCCAGTWSDWVAGGMLAGVRKSKRSGSVSIAEPPWKCAAGVLTGEDTLPDLFDFLTPASIPPATQSDHVPAQ